jgi:hypothetical protein
MIDLLTQETYRNEYNPFLIKIDSKTFKMTMDVNGKFFKNG